MMENDSVFHFYGVSICSGQKKLLLLDAIRPHARTSQTMDELEKKSKIKRKKVDAYCFGSWQQQQQQWRQKLKYYRKYPELRRWIIIFFMLCHYHTTPSLLRPNAPDVLLC